MTDTTVSRLGQVNAAGSVDALFLKVFGGEVLTNFAKSTDFTDKHFVRTIASGKSAQFPMIGSATSGLHTPGTWIDADAINHAEKVITIDELTYAATFIADIDEAMNHYDVRSRYSAELGIELAQIIDKNVARCFILGARSSNALTGRPGGTRISHANMDTDKDALRTSLYLAAQRLDEKYVPVVGRHAFFKPAQYYVMAQDPTLVDKTLGGSGSVASGMVPTAAGFPLVKTNNLPSADDSANTAINAKYRADFSTTQGIVAHSDGAATVKLLDLAMEAQREPRRQGHFVIAKYLVGHDYLRSECSVELYKA